MSTIKLRLWILRQLPPHENTVLENGVYIPRTELDRMKTARPTPKLSNLVGLQQTRAYREN